MEKIQLQRVLPNEIEQRSFEIITQELRERGEQDKILPENELVVKRVIHTTADFDYVDSLCISEGAVAKGIRALQNGACIVTDTQMAKAGINKRKLAQLGGEVFCFISDEDVAQKAKELILQTGVPHIVARGRKGGSNVAVAICNAMLYQI